MKTCFLPILALAGFLSVAPCAYAGEPLRLDDAITRTLGSNPSVIAESAELTAAQARATREALPPPYVMRGEVENVGGSGTMRGFNAAETTLSVSRVVELGGKREAREALGAATVNQQRHKMDSVQLDLTNRTKLRFIMVLARQQQLESAKERVEQAERTRGEIARWVREARNPESELRAAEIALAQAELARDSAQFALSSAKVTLASSWGALTPDFDRVVGELDTLPTVERFETLAARLSMTPESHASKLQAEVLTAERRLAQADAKPDIDVGLGVRRFEATRSQAIMLSVSIPLGTAKRSGYAVAQASAQLAALQARRNADHFERHQTLFKKYQELQHTRNEVESLRNVMVPKAKQALKVTRRGFTAGSFSFLSLSQAQTTLFDLDTRVVDATVRYHSLLAEIERLTAIAGDLTP